MSMLLFYSGLCYQGFVEALLYLAKKKNPTIGDKYGRIKTFLEFCEKNMDEERAKRNAGSGSGRVGMFPMISRQDKAFRHDELTQIYGTSSRKKLGSSYFIDYRNNPPASGEALSINDKNNKKTLRKLKSKSVGSKSVGEGGIVKGKDISQIGASTE